MTADYPQVDIKTEWNPIQFSENLNNWNSSTIQYDRVTHAQQLLYYTNYILKKEIQPQTTLTATTDKIYKLEDRSHGPSDDYKIDTNVRSSAIASTCTEEEEDRYD